MASFPLWEAQKGTRKNLFPFELVKMTRLYRKKVKTMKKELQKEINQKVEQFIDRFDGDTTKHYTSRKQLRTCRAIVYIYADYYVLVSYDTAVAAIDRKDGTCYDFLRLVYGFTSTSAQHIAKFFSDYGCHRWRSEETIYTWRDC